jgi:hypothetical protein
MRPDFNGMRARYSEFYVNWKDTRDLEDKLFMYLFSEVYNDLLSKDIKTFGDWLKYYSTDTNDFSEVVKIVNSYYDKILTRDFDNVTWEERVIGFNSFALYAMEMDIDVPRETSLQGKIMLLFTEIVMNYDLVLKGYLSVRGEILISDHKKSQFYTVWTGSGYAIDQPITLFKS